MKSIAITFSWIAIFGILLGLFFPRKALFWYYGKKSRVFALLIYSTMLLLSFLLFVIAEEFLW